MFGRRSNDPAAPRRRSPRKRRLPAKAADARPVAAEPARVPVKQEAPAPSGGIPRSTTTSRRRSSTR